MIANKKAVFFANMSFFPEFGGVENSISELCEIAKNKHCRPIVITMQSKLKKRNMFSHKGGILIVTLDFYKNNGFVINLISFPFRLFRYFFVIMEIKKRYDIDFAVSRNQWFCLFTCIFFPCKNIFLAPGVNINQGSFGNLDGNEALVRRLKYLANSSMDYFAFIFSRRVAVFSNNMVCQIERIFPRYVLTRIKNKISVVKPGVNSDKFVKLSNDKRLILRESFGFSPDDFVILCIGRFVKAKGFEEAIHAIHFARQSSNIKLLMVGDGPMMGRYKELVYNLGLDHHVYFLGSMRDTSPAYQLADLFFMSSTYEPLGQTIFEAASCCLPIMAYDSNADGVTTATNELLGDDYYKINVCDVSALVETLFLVVSDPLNKRDEMAERARNRLRKYTWAKLFDDLKNMALS